MSRNLMIVNGKKIKYMRMENVFLVGCGTGWRYVRRVKEGHWHGVRGGEAVGVSNSGIEHWFQFDGADVFSDVFDREYKSFRTILYGDSVALLME